MYTRDHKDPHYFTEMPTNVRISLRFAQNVSSKLVTDMFEYVIQALKGLH